MEHWVNRGKVRHSHRDLTELSSSSVQLRTSLGYPLPFTNHRSLLAGFSYLSSEDKHITSRLLP